MEEKEMVIIQNSNGATMEVELITYLVSEDKQKSYLVYSKGEVTGPDSDEVIYIAKLLHQGEVVKIDENIDDTEWLDVQRLLKKIANA